VPSWMRQPTSRPYAGRHWVSRATAWQEWPEDVLRPCYWTLGFLRELFDSRQLATVLGHLDAAPTRNGLPLTRQDARVAPEEQSAPCACELVQDPRLGLEEVRKAVRTCRLQAQGAHDSGERAQQYSLRPVHIRPDRGTSIRGPGAGRRRAANRTPNSTNGSRA